MEAQNQDTLNTKPQAYKDIKEYSNKNKLFKSLHKVLFTNKGDNQKPKQQDTTPEIDYKLYNGKIIRNIDIQTYDPFGFSLTDSARLPKNKIEKGGNWLHVKTKKLTIRNMLLLKRNKPFNELEVKETERIIRSQRYVRQIIITPIPLKNTPDSIDIDIKVLDSWSISPTGTISDSGGSVGLVDRNFGGLGHYFSNQYSTRITDNKHAFRSQYQVNNIANSFVNLGAIYQIDFEKHFQKSIYIDRPFYSPLSKYAGGLAISQTFYRDSLPDMSNNFVYTNLRYNLYDAWVARSFRIKNTNSKEITNFVTAIRYSVTNYKEKPSLIYDPKELYSNQQLFLGSIALTSNQYVKTKFLFNYGIIEDISVGSVFSVTGGFQRKNEKNRPYLGAKFSMGKYINQHFYGFETEWGSFFNEQNLEQTVFRVEGLYFSKAFEIKNWKIRQFINAQVVYGSHRIDYIKDKITLNGKYGIEGFDSYTLTGTKKVLLTLQTQSYAPGQILGFRFSPYAAAGFGWIGDKKERFVSNNLYSKIALGIMINNDYIIFQNIQLSFAYYPTIPGTGRNIIKTNNLRNDNFDLMHFNNVRPAIVPFQ